MIHIGKEIEKAFVKKGIKTSVLASKLNTVPRNETTAKRTILILPPSLELVWVSYYFNVMLLISVVVFQPLLFMK